MRITLKAAREATGRAIVGLAAAVLTVTASAASAQCVGDCNNSGDVTVDEIVTMVNLALNGGVGDCSNGDSNLDGSITVDEIITAVNNALIGCPVGGVCGDGETNNGEDCDDGGICIGDSTAGTACTSDEDCGAGADGVCKDGPDSLRGCDSDDDCEGSVCIRCKTFGGDGCAANCTDETTINLALQAGELASMPGFDGGVCVGGDNAGNACAGDGDCLSTVITQPGFCLAGSTAAVFGPLISLPLNLSGTGSAKLTIGKAGDDGIIPVVLPAADVDIPRIAISSIACACVRGAAASTCGGVSFYKDGTQAINCTEGFDGEETCPVDLPCAPMNGAGNTGSGFIGCQGLSPNEVLFDLDCNGVPGQEPGEPIITLGEEGGPGSAFIILNAAIGTVVGACSGSSPDYGPDSEFCTDDDPLSGRGAPNTVPMVTGSASGVARNAFDFPGDDVGPHATNGAPFVCSGDTITSTTGVNLAGVFASCDQPTINDIVVPINFISQ
jgi:hypothetical protein